jgi:HD-like signal output (HDOD) protein/CheY-like chemotaxis protein
MSQCVGLSVRRVLFVDDEPDILSGLRRMLRGKTDWELTFADSGVLALAQLGTQPVDVVVSDMRMPGMDGGELLSHVRRLYPSTACLILSEHADHEDIIAAVGTTQQILFKPCDADVLIHAINRVVTVRDKVTDERLQGILGDVDALPIPPLVHGRLIEVSARPNSGLADVVAVLESDLALCAEILKLVNSAFFGLRSHVESVGRAVSLLGIDTIHALALSGKVFGSGPTTPQNLDVLQMRRTGMRAAGYARAIAASEGWAPETTGRAFLSALLRDLGLLMLAADTAGYDQVRAVPPEDQWARSNAELETFGCTVPEASAYLLGLWGFSESVLVAVACQPTRPEDSATTPISHVVSFAHLRALVNYVASDAEAGSWNEARNQRWNNVCDAAGALG